MNAIIYNKIALALGKKDMASIKLYLSIDMRLYENDFLNRSLLHIACQENAFKMVKYLIENKLCEINGSDRYFSTPLHYACKWGSNKIIRILLKNGANCFLQDHLLRTPIHIVCMYRKVHTIKVIMSHRNRYIDIYTPLDLFERNPIHLACVHNTNKDVILYLLTFISFNTPEVKIPMMAKLVYNILAWIAESHNKVYCINKNVSTILHLYGNKQNINRTNHKQQTLLHLAAQHNMCSFIKLILKFDIDVNARDFYGKTALHYAADMQYTDVIKLLLETKKENLMIHDYNFYTPLQYACEYNYHNTEIIGLLLNYYGKVQLAAGAVAERTASSESQIIAVQTPKIIFSQNMFSICFVSAIKNGGKRFRTQNTILRYIISNALDQFPHLRVTLTELRHTIDEDNDEIARCLLSKMNLGVSGGLEQGCQDDYTDFIYQVCLRNAKKLYELIFPLYKDNININHPDNESIKFDILHQACKDPLFYKFAKFILHKDCQLVNKKNHNYFTPMHFAVCNSDTVKLLLRYGAKINERDLSGKTALHYACIKGVESTVTLLLDHNIDTTLHDHRRMTAFAYACKYNYKSIIQLFFRINYRFVNKTDELENAVLNACLTNTHYSLSTIATTTMINAGFRNEDETLLMIVIKRFGDKSSIRLLQLLCNIGVDINARKNGVLSNFAIASEHRMLKVIKFLLDNKAEISNDLISGAMGRDLDIIDLLLNSESVDLYTRFLTINHSASLIEAFHQSRHQLIRLLLNVGFQFDMNHIDYLQSSSQYYSKLRLIENVKQLKNFILTLYQNQNTILNLQQNNLYVENESLVLQLDHMSNVRFDNCTLLDFFICTNEELTLDYVRSMKGKLSPDFNSPKNILLLDPIRECKPFIIEKFNFFLKKIIVYDNIFNSLNHMEIKILNRPLPIELNEMIYNYLSYKDCYNFVIAFLY